MNTSKVAEIHSAALPGADVPVHSLANPMHEECWEWAKLRKMTLKQMDKFMALVPLVLRDEDLTSVNGIRITCRRLEQILELVYAKPRPRHIKRLRRRLKLCRQTLGTLRNCEAMLAWAERSIAGNDPYMEAWRGLREYLCSRRRPTAQQSLEKLGRVNVALPYLRIKRDLAMDTDQLRGSNGGIANLALTPAELVRQQITRSLRHRWRELEARLDRSHTDPSTHVVHGVRIAAKRLRCLIEVMSKLHMEGSAEVMEWLKSLQKTIGLWHDLEILEKMLRGILLNRESLRMSAAVTIQIEDLIQNNRTIKKASSQQFFMMTRRSADFDNVKKWVDGILHTRADQMGAAGGFTRPV
jgi:CHAD domain-containing protein